MARCRVERRTTGPDVLDCPGPMNPDQVGGSRGGDGGDWLFLSDTDDPLWRLRWFPELSRVIDAVGSAAVGQPIRRAEVGGRQRWVYLPADDMLVRLDPLPTLPVSVAGPFADAAVAYLTQDDAERARSFWRSMLPAVLEYRERRDELEAAEAAPARSGPSRLTRKQRAKALAGGATLQRAGYGSPVALTTPGAVRARSGTPARSAAVRAAPLPEAVAAGELAAAEAAAEGASAEAAEVAGIAAYVDAGGAADVDDVAALFDYAAGLGDLERTPASVLLLLLVALPDEVLNG